MQKLAQVMNPYKQSINQSYHIQKLAGDIVKNKILHKF